jgi:transcription-repair coupling factor (superfamily II helicase)
VLIGLTSRLTDQKGFDLLTAVLEPMLRLLPVQFVIMGSGDQRYHHNLADLHPGAPVVHEEHGIGRYVGLETLEVGGQPGEFLTIEYAGGDKLYVPVADLHLVTRYTGASPESAPLHKLGSGQWERARKRAAKRARDAAAELLELYAKRAARQGTPFQVDNEAYRAFAAAFPFEETPDEAKAIEDVLADMALERPMDRVVCGDVGFGKTEVAMRAAFVAAENGRQVAVLAPTTLLVQQHLQTFRDRFAGWPVRIEALSRFGGAKAQKRILEDLAAGKVDIVIGTHKLLQPDVRFKRLGLVIVDEEHRFGVRHKERLKALRAEVDLLTLTATPIPRTLNMSLAGLRDLSIIATPPVARHAIKTFVTQWNDALIQEAVERELRRGGQIYFVHNEVKGIDRQAARLRKLLPGVEIRIAHGQMPERELEQVMLDFYHQRFQVLVCTTIIESGIDVPTANTMIIHRADRFGLSQLHQLRGRVGRSHHRAYAYLLAPPRAAMTADAVKRLEAIAALEDLGVGFTLATHDLEIRGAGELLGEEQSGQIQEVGFALYNELLERAVRALKRGEIPDEAAPASEHGVTVDLGAPALLPADYVPDVHTRLVLYKRISAAADEAALRELQVEMIDRFGLLPEPARTLFETISLKQQAAPLGVVKLELGPRGGRIRFAAEPRIDTARLIRLIQRDPRRYRLKGDWLRFELPLPEVAERIEFVTGLLQSLVPEKEAA